jgi:hypothetical protein
LPVTFAAPAASTADRQAQDALLREAEAHRALADLFPHLQLDALRAIQDLFPVKARREAQQQPVH